MSIGIVGGGIAALHLGLALRPTGMSEVTLYVDRDYDEIAAGPLLNTVVHHHPTVLRERELDVAHWDTREYGYSRHHHSLGGSDPVRFTGDFTYPSLAVDHRLYLPALAADFAERGGDLRVLPIGPHDLSALAAQHDLVVVASGRGLLSGLFERRAALSPFDRPQRRICVGLYTGVTRPAQEGVGISIAPDVGELLEIPLVSRHGWVTALLFETLPDTETAALLQQPGGTADFHRAVLDTLRAHHPSTFERVDVAEFQLTDLRDLLQGGIVPSVRRDYFHIEHGVYALALGDAHVVVDPVMGQGANIAAYSAAVVASHCGPDVVYDELFCTQVARTREAVLIGASQWTNLTLEQHPRIERVLRAAARNSLLANTFTDNFDHPDRQWEALATDQRADRFIGHQLGALTTHQGR
ncbi:styrene monooxygenase/indole monooxygenase family protein [Nocardia abscessus]|uniref:styrene monooxygenase/indole monooxygenase family protein n=1 Tax=Nocardia abscessus TaxID=120957 RepID=UPI0005BC6324|nr:styrene monooxygenase/indole monooxygenase family protein [Nocardia abscessus]MCC3332212.1 monooxygenase [Nocardia abscessus]